MPDPTPEPTDDPISTLVEGLAIASALRTYSDGGPPWKLFAAAEFLRAVPLERRAAFWPERRRRSWS